MPVIGYDEAQEKDARHRHVRLSREITISSPAEQCRIEDDADRSIRWLLVMNHTHQPTAKRFGS
jgi:hypothetical protein